MRRAPCPRRRIASLKMCSTFPLVLHKCAEAAGTQAVVPPAFQRMSVVHEIHVHGPARASSHDLETGQDCNAPREIVRILRSDPVTMVRKIRAASTKISV